MNQLQQANNGKENQANNRKESSRMALGEPV